MSVIQSMVRRAARARRSRGVVRILRTESEVAAVARALAQEGRSDLDNTAGHLLDLYAEDGASLYLHIEQKRRRFELVFTRSNTVKLVISAHALRLEAETEEPAANGAYLVERQYRRLGFYADRQADRAVILVHIAPGHAPLYLVAYPPYMERATIVVNGERLATGVRLSTMDDVRYRVGPPARHVRRQLRST